MEANFPGFNSVVLSVVGDVSVDSEAPVVTSSISPGFITGPVFEDAHRGECACVVSVCVVLCNSQKKNGGSTYQSKFKFSTLNLELILELFH